MDIGLPKKGKAWRVWWEASGLALSGGRYSPFAIDGSPHNPPNRAFPAQPLEFTHGGVEFKPASLALSPALTLQPAGPCGRVGGWMRWRPPSPASRAPATAPLRGRGGGTPPTWTSTTPSTWEARNLYQLHSLALIWGMGSGRLKIPGNHSVLTINGAKYKGVANVEAHLEKFYGKDYIKPPTVPV